MFVLQATGLSAGLAGYDHGAASGALQNLVALKGDATDWTSMFPPENFHAVCIFPKKAQLKAMVWTWMSANRKSGSSM